VLSVITFGELVYGAEKSVQQAAALELLRELAQVLPVMGLPEMVADAYGTMRAELERKQMIGNNDCGLRRMRRRRG
jgi:tRNA(fMet)-specific endonuclease VapC